MVVVYGTGLIFFIKRIVDLAEIYLSRIFGEQHQNEVFPCARKKARRYNQHRNTLFAYLSG